MFRTAVAAVVATFVLIVASCGGDGVDNRAARGDDTTTSPRAATVAGGEISVLSYNVAGLPQEISEVQPSEHIPLISPLLNDSDIVLTQEDFDWWRPALDGLDFARYHERLRAEVTHEHRSSRHPGPDAVGLDLAGRPLMQIGDGLGLLSRYPISNERRIPWTGCYGSVDTSDGGAGDCLAMKGFSIVTVELARGATVEVVDLHLEAGGTVEDQRLQEADIDQLVTALKALDGRPIILGGDTNLHTGGDHPDGSNGADTALWNRLVDEIGLTDACAATKCPDTTRIDKIAVRSGEGVTLDVKQYRILADRFVDADGVALSDHDPLAVKIRWTPTS